MSMLTLREAQSLLPGATLVGAPDTVIARVHTDTRTLQPGDLFVALRGERFDGHDHLAAAQAAGAAAAIAERALDPAALPGLLVPDTLTALQALSAAWRARFEALPLVAVTGSNGKTTVTQMTASILRAWQGDAALGTAGNFNNHIGVPLTLLRLRPEHRAAVVELGMNHPGEIAELARLVRPTVALVNNAQREHQEFMASVEAVARENGSVIEALGAGGCAVFPADDAFTPLWAELAGARRVLRFGPGGEVRGQAQWVADHWSLALDTPMGSARLALRMPGEHNVRNALAAAACALAAGAPLAAVVQGLEAFQPVAGRSQLKKLLRGGAECTLVDDSYNANPDSVRAAIELLAALPAPRALLLGDMGEVGDQGPAFHAEVGALAAQRGIEHFWCAGTLCAHAAQAYGAGARHFASTEALLDAVPALPQVPSVLVKGSRFMRMERVLPLLGEVR
ncbi:UDP-N-acetylmuramoyl-tripeptide--D-alanyl-D-alanine ligase [Azohydromonas lata]|uniref:UDP-N-acetylmuramoyl-tripeptide--D-alanyl-D-alanine ligase n=1 Tax=Azohydromonas lata TaxID=45677 RepID=A0ABU5IAE2_9BURK|nr:UDP-N-acetylmuramoyl-tripeptide--D-alanyl-D-alanine ligase [Azohydromonas lata]MDZ5455510.1 UDP-N-acetylmuramoyl-tripeptide--D-alanyl-D-alanine ligase [Azohydromonas lata]